MTGKETGTAETSLGVQVSSGGETAGGGGGGDGGHLSPNASSYNVYETRYQRSLRNYLTRETLPSEAHYRNMDSVMVGYSRPTIDELHNHTVNEREVRKKYLT